MSDKTLGEMIGHFQTSLSTHGQAKITVQASDQVLSSIAILDEFTSAALARQTGLHPMTVNRYVRGDSSPSICRLTRILDKLEYDLYLVKRK